MKNFHLLILCVVGLALLVTIQPAAAKHRCWAVKCRVPRCSRGTVRKRTGNGCWDYTCEPMEPRDCRTVKCRMPRCSIGTVPKKTGEGCCSFTCEPRRLQGDGPYVKVGFNFKWDQLPEDDFDEDSYDTFDDEDSYDAFDDEDSYDSDGPYVKVGFNYKWDQLPEDNFDEDSYDDFE